MKVQVETLSPSKRRLAIEIPEDEVTAEIERAYSKLARHAQVPGFRPGHVPRSVLERRFGDRVRGEVFGKLIQDSYSEALRDEHIEAVGQPEIVTEQAEPGSPLRFGATVEVRPEVQLQSYEDLELERAAVDVGDEDIERTLSRLQESYAQLTPIENRTAVERGDVAVIDYQGRVDGKVALQEKDRPCEVGAGKLPEAFEARLVGADVGETLEFPVTFAEDDSHAAMAGKTVEFQVSIKSLASKYVPPLDDDFAKDHGECGTLEELRAKIRTQLEEATARQAEEELRSAAVSKLVAAHDIELPESLVARQIERLMMEVAEGWRARRIWPKDEAAAFASLREELRPQAERQVKAVLVLDAVAEQERVEVGEEDIDSEFARASGGEVTERVRAMAADADVRRNVAERLRREKALDLILERARIRTA